MSKWIHNGTPLTEPPQDTWGFVYRVTWNEGFYIGQKSFWSVTNPKISKKRSQEIYKGRGKRPTKERKVKESDWRNYKTSSSHIKDHISQYGEQGFVWEIIDFSKSKSELDYMETQYILCSNALKDPRCHNMWVSVKIHKNNI